MRRTTSELVDVCAYCGSPITPEGDPTIKTFGPCAACKPNTNNEGRENDGT